jgi:ferredoxin
VRLCVRVCVLVAAWLAVREGDCEAVRVSDGVVLAKQVQLYTTTVSRVGQPPPQTGRHCLDELAGPTCPVDASEFAPQKEHETGAPEAGFEKDTEAPATVAKTLQPDAEKEAE